MRNFFRRFVHAWAGFLHFLRSEPNARFHSVASLLALGLGLYLRIDRYEFLWLLLAISAVFGSELLNSALERLADRVSTEKHELIKQAKDMAAAAVLVFSLFALVTGCLIFIPKLL